MAGKALPARSRALTAMRAAIGWDQTELANAAGKRPSVISDYERGHKRLSQGTLEELAASMGLSPDDVAQALSFVERMSLAAGAAGNPGDVASVDRKQVEAIAAEVERLAGGFARSVLNRLMMPARALAARQEAPELWAALKRRPSSEWPDLVKDVRNLRSWGLAELLCAESVKAAPDSADRALELAELALHIAELVPGDETWRWRLQGYAWAHVANGRRVRGDLAGAEEAFDLASRLWAAGEPGDPGFLDDSQMLSLEASLRISQTRLSEAEALLNRALEADRGALKPKLLIKRARLLEWAGDFEGALAVLGQAASLVSPKAEPRLLCMLRFNPLWNLCHLGRFGEAEALLPEVRKLVRRLDNELDALRLRWLEGRIAAGVGRTEEALLVLSQVRSGFADRGIAYDAALATLELAVLHLKRGRSREVKELVRESAPIFKAQGVHHEALAALTLFCEAAEKESASVELACRIVKYLYRARHDPQLRFEANE